MSKSETIKVAFRLRPLNSTEKQDGRKVCCVVHEDEGVIEMQYGDSSKRFTFDSVFSASSSQRRIYDVTTAPLVQSVLEGFNGTVFAYGQTGAGKTHTMEGSIIPTTFEHIFDHIALNSAKDRYLVHASFFEIYNEEIRDLLTAGKSQQNSLELRESTDAGVYVQGLTSTVVKSASEIDAVLQNGNKNRSVGSTLMNSQSSRSHSIFSIVVECCSTDEHNNEHIRVGKLNLVDLAGSERQSKTGATGERLKEATKINLSLSALGNVISALVDGKAKHIPYRDSKLTRILQDSLGGNTKTVMLANAGPADCNADESLSTLRYANRAKNIKNKPVINEDPKDTLLRGYQEEIARLKERLAQMSSPEAQLVRSTVVENSAAKESLPKLEQEHHDEKASLQKKLEDEQKARMDTEKERRELQQHLVEMEAKLIVGGEIASSATKQEAALRKANQELIAKRESELMLTRRMNEQEEEKLNLEERYKDVATEVKEKTRKLQRVWVKYQQAKSEIKDMEQEALREHTEMLDTIRELNKQLKLKEFVISSFIPPQYALLYDDVDQGGRAVWEEAREAWTIPGLNTRRGNRLRERQASGRPETEFSREMKMVDSNPRWRSEDIVDLDLVMPVQKAPAARDDPNTIDAIAAILAIDMDDKVDELPLNEIRKNRQKKYLKAESSKQKQKRRKDKAKSRPTTAAL
ncbi:kinesin family protein [Skeletonema marinoi]|uniref:Kinesin-like protein n=1 Tax=Skeletonema marinoi TaxID=267567 RepID=A0AAD8YH47_9STRA|nr:kinesin family protein [Skeletonema marinoi]